MAPSWKYTCASLLVLYFMKMMVLLLAGCKGVATKQLVESKMSMIFAIELVVFVDV